MNEIKFRVWDKVIKVMREVLSIDFENQEVICPPRGHEFSEWYNQHLSFNEVLILQNTGLKDKNGKEIYVGDIDTDEHGNLNVVCYIKKYGAYCFVPLELYVSEDYENEVMYEYGYDCFFHNIVPSEYAEIIGNIFEHPHLIGGKHG